MKQRDEYIVDESEILKDYKYLKEELQELGYIIQSVTLDGKRGLYKALKIYRYKCVTSIKRK